MTPEAMEALVTSEAIKICPCRMLICRAIALLFNCICVRNLNPKLKPKFFFLITTQKRDCDDYAATGGTAEGGGDSSDDGRASAAAGAAREKKKRTEILRDGITSVELQAGL